MTDEQTPPEEFKSTEVDPVSHATPERIGPYRILQKIGEGGMGEVYLAEQKEPVRRRVALKIIKRGMDTDRVIARFEAERQALAMMNHPSIAQVFDAGTTELGRPFFVMEHVKGVPITEYCDRQRLTNRERLQLFIAVCEGVHHAHQKGIIHRDIKPSNILVQTIDDRRMPKIIDFGVAKATAQRLTERTIHTQLGVLIGTPEYMSPEQAEMTAEDVDSRTDVYSLGVVLYQLLIGALPFDSKELRTAGFDEIRRRIREEEPPTPSTRVTKLEAADAIAMQRQTDVRGLHRQLRGDLDWITMKALEKDRARRYASASEFAADIHRHLNDEPVAASPPSMAYRIGKFARKHRGPVVAAGMIVATIVVLGSVALWQGWTAQQQARRIQANAVLIAAAAADDPLLKALLLDELTGLPELPGKLNIAREVANFPLPVAVLRGHEWTVTSADFSPDGALVVTGSRDGTARVWRSDGTGSVVVLRGHTDEVWGVHFSPDGSSVLTAADDGTARIWPASGEGQPLVLRHEEPIDLGGPDLHAAFSSDGSQVVTGGRDGVARVWRTDSTEEPIVLDGHEHAVSSVAFGPDGKRVATSALDGTARIWLADGTGSPLVLVHEGGVRGVSFSSDGTRVVTASNQGTVRVWPIDGEEEPVELAGPSNGFVRPSFSPDGTLVAMLEAGAAVRVRRADGTGEPLILGGPGSKLSGAAFSPDGKRILAWSSDGIARMFALDRPFHPVEFQRHAGGIYDAVFSPDGTRFVTVSTDGTARVWRTEDRGETTVIEGGAFASFSADGTRVITASQGAAKIWREDGTGAPVVYPLRENERVLALSPDWTWVIGCPHDPAIRRACREALVRRLDGTGEPVRLGLQQGSVCGAAFSPDGRRVFLASEEGPARVQRADGSGKPIVLRGSVGECLGAFSPDGRQLVTGSTTTGSTRVWQLDEPAEPVLLRGHGNQMNETNAVAFSPDGRFVVSVGLDGTGRISPADGTQEAVVFRVHSDETFSIEFSPDGTRLVSGDLLGNAKVWRRDGSGEPLVLTHQAPVLHASFSPDGTRVVTTSWDGTARIWSITWPRLMDYLRDKVNACLTPEHRVRYLAESRSDASDAYVSCERRFGRKP